ncbi:MAG TPA: DUF5674 family protein, partial [bacterium]|nr:DUF5674 family protein [bacterium]
MYIIREPASLKKIWEEREVDLGSMIKIVVDVNRRVLAIDAQLHADEEQRLLEDGSKQEDVWGANIHPF